MRSFGHWTPRYVVDRVSLYAYNRLHPDEPWLTPQMVELLESWIRPTDVGMEFGSGRSTLWFASRMQTLTSVEHDAVWFGIVRDKLAGANRRVDYRLCEDGGGQAAGSAYVGVALGAPVGSLDFALVDGAARDHCALALLDKMRTGGILLVDNINWYLPHERTKSPGSRRERDGCASDEWRRFRQEVRAWRHVWTSSGVSDTALWVKP